MADDFLGNAAGLAATGIGLGILTAGALVPLIITKQVLENGGVSTKKGVKMKMPKLNVTVKKPKSKIKKIKMK